MLNASTLFQRLKYDLPASLVVFLVALPLCLGIAIASGVPPALGLITGIIGGIIVGCFSGAPLQVSGPAAGLTVIVFSIVKEFGLPGLALAVFLAGCLQLVAGLSGLGRWFKAISPAVVYGMLAGIGIIIMASQFHLMMDNTPYASPLHNLLTIPYTLYQGLFTGQGFFATKHQQAVFIGIITILVLLGWEKYKPKALTFLPGALIAVMIATGLDIWLGFVIQHIEIPAKLSDAITWLSLSQFNLLSSTDFIHAVFGLAIIASAETLLSAAAVDKLQTHAHTHYNQELAAQGLGNILCGVLGALPMTGVIVRSTANIEAGARTRLSTILHGLWILTLVLNFPFVLSMIPIASLAAILVYTGYKLVNFMAIKKIATYGKSELIIYGVTVAGIVTLDLLTGVLAGLICSLFKLMITFSNTQMTKAIQEDKIEVSLKGAATVITLPKIAAYFEPLVKQNKPIVIHLDDLLYIDHACMDFIEQLSAKQTAKGLTLTIDHEVLKHRIHKVYTHKPPLASRG